MQGARAGSKLFTNMKHCTGMGRIKNAITP